MALEGASDLTSKARGNISSTSIYLEQSQRENQTKMSEPLEVMMALANFIRESDEELAEFHNEQGKNALGRAVDLPHVW